MQTGHDSLDSSIKEFVDAIGGTHSLNWELGIEYCDGKKNSGRHTVPTYVAMSI